MITRILTMVLIVAASPVYAADGIEFPKPLQGYYAVWTDIDKDGKISAAPEKDRKPIFYIGATFVGTIGIGWTFDRIERTQTETRTLYVCHVKKGEPGGARTEIIEDLGNGIVLISENGEHMLWKKTGNELNDKPSDAGGK